MQSSSEPQITFLHLHALNLFGSWSNVCKNGQLSTCQTPAQVTCAHCQRSSDLASAPHPFCLLTLSAEASEGAAHYRVIFVAVNTLLRFFSCCRPVWAPPEGLTLWEASTSSSTPLFRFNSLSFRFDQTPLRGPRIIGEHQIPSTPQRISFSCRGSLPMPLQGRALCTAAIDLGRGDDHLDEKFHLRNGSIRFLESNLCVFYP